MSPFWYARRRLESLRPTNLGDDLFVMLVFPIVSQP